MVYTLLYTLGVYIPPCMPPWVPLVGAPPPVLYSGWVHTRVGTLSDTVLLCRFDTTDNCDSVLYPGLEESQL